MAALDRLTQFVMMF